MIRGRLAALVVSIIAPVFAESVTFRNMEKAVIEHRLHLLEKKDELRLETLKSLYNEVGCGGEKLREQPVKGLKLPNLICSTQQEGGVILIGAHFDHVSGSPGVTDNWSGASLLPSLYESLTAQPRKHALVFVNFSGEEKGLVGSAFYVKSLSDEEKSRIRAMVNLDTLGLSPAKVWLSKADPELAKMLFSVASALKLPIAGVSGDQVGSSDFAPFLQAGIPQIMIHSVTQDTLRLLHSPSDNFKALHLDEYYDTYRLVTTFIAYLDTRLP